MSSPNPYTRLKDRSLKMVRAIWGFKKLVECNITCLRCGKVHKRVLPVGSKVGLCNSCRSFANSTDSRSYDLGTID